MNLRAERVLDSGDALGECPIWDERLSALWWVDIHGRAIKRYDGENVRILPMPEPPGSIAWSPDGRTMYFADSPRHKIWAFDYDGERGEISGERVFATPHPGFPDGSCVDAEGCLWNAEWGAGRVVRYTPAGKIDRIVEVPAKNPTCCCFGGSGLDTLYITSAKGAGLFACAPGVKGLAES